MFNFFLGCMVGGLTMAIILCFTVNSEYSKKLTFTIGYGITNAYTKTEVDDLINALQAKITELESKIPSGSLATVATTGSYKDLIDLPTKLNEIKDY